MSAVLCPFLPSTFSDVSNIDSFFGVKGKRDLQTAEAREQPILGKTGDSCRTNLFFGFFFDGTKNNYVQAEKTKSHSNLARLYDCYPGLSVPGVLPAETDWKYNSSNYTHFFKAYIPGVATPFKEVNDTGAGSELMRGAAMGYRGETRIIWALIQAINNVHRYCHKPPLVSATEAADLITGIDLSPASRGAMGDDSYFSLRLGGAQRHPQHDSLSAAQRKAAEEYIRTKRIPSMLTEGREPFQWMGISSRAGYLRYRKIYGGSDSVLLSDASTDQLESANLV